MREPIFHMTEKKDSLDIMLEMNNKVSVQDLYNEMLKKADINGLKVLEASLIRLNDLINDLAN